MKQIWRLAPIVLLALAVACSGGDPATPGRDGATSRNAEIDREEVERLRALGYAGVAEALADDQEAGVVFHDPERAAPGLNLFTSSHTCQAQLMDMEGELLHSWSYQPCFRWGNALLLPEGDLVVPGRLPYDRSDHKAAWDARRLWRFSWDGELEWMREMPGHHDVAVRPDGDLLLLTYRHEIMPEVHPEIPVRRNFIVRLSPEGELLEELSLYDLLRSAPEIFELEEVTIRDFDGLNEVDLFHSNSVEWINRPDLVGRHPIYDPGNVLVCVRNQDLVAVVDWEARKLVWAWGPGEISGPHDTTLLPNGNILIFDNGLGRSWSRVVEVSPATRRIVWEYGEPGEGSFYTSTRGSNQRLSNGNTLVVESGDGRAFEVTPEGEVVWDFINFNLTEKREPSVIVRMRRYEGLGFEELEASVREGSLAMQD